MKTTANATTRMPMEKNYNNSISYAVAYDPNQITKRNRRRRLKDDYNNNGEGEDHHKLKEKQVEQIQQDQTFSTVQEKSTIPVIAPQNT